MKEVWVRYEDTVYEVSNLGRIRTLRKTGYKYLNPSKCPRGYRNIVLRKAPQKYWRVARLVMHVFKGSSKLQVDHINTSKSDDRLINLEYVTPSENKLRTIRGIL